MSTGCVGSRMSLVGCPIYWRWLLLYLLLLVVASSCFLLVVVSCSHPVSLLLLWLWTDCCITSALWVSSRHLKFWCCTPSGYIGIGVLVLPSFWGHRRDWKLHNIVLQVFAIHGFPFDNTLRRQQESTHHHYCHGDLSTWLALLTSS